MRQSLLTIPKPSLSTLFVLRTAAIILAVLACAASASSETNETSLVIQGPAGLQAFVGPLKLPASPDQHLGMEVPGLVSGGTHLRGTTPLPPLPLAPGVYEVALTTDQVSDAMRQVKKDVDEGKLAGQFTFFAGSIIDFRGRVKTGCVGVRPTGQSGMLVLAVRDGALVMFGKIVEIRVKAGQQTSVTVTMPSPAPSATPSAVPPVLPSGSPSGSTTEPK